MLLCIYVFFFFKYKQCNYLNWTQYQPLAVHLQQSSGWEKERQHRGIVFSCYIKAPTPPFQHVSSAIKEPTCWQSLMFILCFHFKQPQAYNTFYH